MAKHFKWAVLYSKSLLDILIYTLNILKQVWDNYKRANSSGDEFLKQYNCELYPYGTFLRCVHCYSSFLSSSVSFLYY